jgi:hypothetical protein
LNKEGANHSTTNKSEPLFIEFANFDFTKEPIEKFFKILEHKAVLSSDELLIYFRPQDDNRFDDSCALTESEKAKISEELESDRQEFRKLLSVLTFVREKYDFVNENYDACLESINSLCAEIPIKFAQDKIHFGKLNIALPSLEKIDIEEVGWAGFIIALMAIDLGKYLMRNPATRIRLCANHDCQKFFTRRRLNSEFCSEDCHDLYHRKRLGKEYFRKAVAKTRRLKKEKES